MRVFVKGAARIHGIGKTSKKPYDFCQLETMVPAECVAQGDYNRTAFGMQDMKPLNLDPSLMPFFHKNHAMFPCEIEVVLELRPHMGEYVNTVVNVAPVSKTA